MIGKGLERRSYRVFTIILLIFLCNHSWADIYMYIDEEGVRHFTDSPMDRRYKLYWKRPYSSVYDDLIKRVAKKYGLSPALLKAIIKLGRLYTGPR